MSNNDELARLREENERLKSENYQLELLGIGGAALEAGARAGAEAIARKADQDRQRYEREIEELKSKLVRYGDHLRKTFDIVSAIRAEARQRASEQYQEEEALVTKLQTVPKSYLSKRFLEIMNMLDQPPLKLIKHMREQTQLDERETIGYVIAVTVNEAVEFGKLEVNARNRILFLNAAYGLAYDPVLVAREIIFECANHNQHRPEMLTLQRLSDDWITANLRYKGGRTPTRTTLQVGLGIAQKWHDEEKRSVDEDGRKKRKTRLTFSKEEGIDEKTLGYYLQWYAKLVEIGNS